MMARRPGGRNQSFGQAWCSACSSSCNSSSGHSSQRPLENRIMSRQMTMGVLVGNRGFFPSHLATSGRLEIVAALESAGIKPIVLSPEATAHGAVESYEDAKKCAALFKQHAADIDGLIITLPNFGEER